ncbi:MAG TPA: rhodanese-related sulfurtransferase [Leptolyngbyaceae cyanobacterium M65_K2018_010]|nr:rhodanese-related sulfurtransferase [Leptolyngbyaceae cyanobacterium M65_K2018_010]
MSWTVATFYKFAPLTAPAQLQQDLRVEGQRLGLKGTLILASEGINATVAGSRPAIDQILTWLQHHPDLGYFTHQEFETEVVPFARLKVKLKPEIVSLGRPDINPSQGVGTYVDPQDWNALITDPEVVVIDTRNAFEVDLGTFSGALNPQTRSFRDFPAYLESTLHPADQPKIALFCTGGIRCEKATAYLRQQGFSQVYHLQGGILNYLRQVPPVDSLWQGQCFVFDDRVALDHQLQATPYQLCPGCGHPLGPTDTQSPDYEPGISCPHCYHTLTPERRARLAARQRWA